MITVTKELISVEYKPIRRRRKNKKMSKCIICKRNRDQTAVWTNSNICTCCAGDVYDGIKTEMKGGENNVR